VTVAEFAPEFLETYAATNNKASEVVTKEVILRVHLVPFFGKRRLDQITARNIEEYKAAMRRDGLKPKTINNHLSVLRKMLSTAKEWNIAADMPPMKRLIVHPPKFDWLNREESIAFLETIDRHEEDWSPLFWTALRAGLRRGEILALKKDELSFARRTLTVSHSLYRGTLETPKNGRTRTIPMSAGLAQVLKRYVEGLKGEILFPDPEGALTDNPEMVDAPLRRALQKAGLRRIRFHDLRHSFASQLVSAGRSLKEVQELMGHVSIQSTMRYAHLAPERLREAINVLDEGGSGTSSGTLKVA
jgi:integrase